jgi:hypothetical protein
LLMYANSKIKYFLKSREKSKMVDS